MFKYKSDDYTIVDAERGLVVEQVGGPGHGIYAGEMRSSKWKFKFLIHLLGENLDCDNLEATCAMKPTVHLHISVSPVVGDYNFAIPPFELAREAAIAHEVGLTGCSPEQIVTNAPAAEITTDGISDAISDLAPEFRKDSLD